MKLKDFFESKLLKGFLLGIGACAVLLVVFKAGMVVGFRKASFSSRWGEHYYKNFGGPRGGFMKGLGDRDFLNAHGVAGQVIKINDNTLIVKGRDDIEKIVLLIPETTFRRFKETIKLSDLAVDDFIVIIGEPNEAGQIEAKLIRVLPSPSARR